MSQFLLDRIWNLSGIEQVNNLLEFAANIHNEPYNR
jgi:hypothetical protein